MKRSKVLAVSFLTLLCLQVNRVYSQEENVQTSESENQFKDSEDGAFDISLWLTNAYGFLPIVSIITEPAVGYGASGGLVFVHKKREDLEEGNASPPGVSFLGGLYTENGTWGVLAGHRGYYKQDRIRYAGALGYFSTNLAIYRPGPSGEEELSFNMKGSFTSHELTHRLGSSKSFLGFSYLFSRNEVNFSEPEFIPIDVPGANFETVISSLGLIYNYDSRDFTFTPNSGVYGNISYSINAEIIGSDFNYSRLDSYFLFYKQFSRVISGLRTEYRSTFSNPPFFAKPYVILRGVPVMRYQSKNVMVVESEQRWDLTKRWSAVGFLGYGKAFESFDSWSEIDDAWSVGGGFRYLLARYFNLYAGMDVARGPEQWAFYIQVGHYWNNLRG